MEHRLIFSQELEKKLNSSSTNTKKAWKDIGVTSYKELIKLTVNKLNTTFNKLNITECDFIQDVSIYGQSNTYFGLIKNLKGIVLAYVFVIPPKYETRSGVLAQQVFPVMSGITPILNESKDIRITNRPVYIINLNEANLTPSMAVNVISGQILGFRYVDIFERNIDSILLSDGISPGIRNVDDYDEMITRTNKSRKNEFFTVDKKNKVVTFLKTRLKDGIHVNNEPYWFVLKAYAAVYLAKMNGYKFDMSQINKMSRGNKTLDAFRDFVKKVDK